MARLLCTGFFVLTILLWITCAFPDGPRIRRSCLIGWDAVTTDANGDPLTDLAGYRVYTSTTSMLYGAPTLTVASGTTQATCRQLGLYLHNQQYYLRVAAYDTNGNESVPSQELAVVVTMGGVLFR